MNATNKEPAMTTATKTLTLAEYASSRENVVLFWAGVGAPTGDYSPVGHADMDFPEQLGLLGLTGSVDESGDWRWDGEGKPTDDRANTIYKLHAYVDAKKWASMDAEYNEEG